MGGGSDSGVLGARSRDLQCVTRGRRTRKVQPAPPPFRGDAERDDGARSCGRRASGWATRTVAMRSVTWRRVLRVAGWNAVVLACGLGLVVVAAEGWLRLKRPFRDRAWTTSYVPGVTRVFVPHSESRWTDHKEFWQVSRANSLGFLDREPPSPELARAGCHVAVVGDSFVEAMEVALADRSHVLLEGMAAAQLPHLDVVTTAWGVNSTGQVQQLPMWDKWIRLWSPDLMVLLFVHNDFSDNARGDWTGGGGETELDLEVEGPRIATAHRTAGGRIVLRLPGTALVPREVLVPREREGGWAREWPAGLRPWLLPWLRHKRGLLATAKGGGGGRATSWRGLAKSRSRLHGVRARPVAGADATGRLAARRLVDQYHAPRSAAGAGGAVRASGAHCGGSGHSAGGPIRLHRAPGRRPARRELAARLALEPARPPMGGGSDARAPGAKSRGLRRVTRGPTTRKSGLRRRRPFRGNAARDLAARVTRGPQARKSGLRRRHSSRQCGA